MALKRQYEMSSLFSMASMTDIIFLLLIFFMVTSTYVFPTALELNLPQSSEQTAIKPQVYVHVLPDGVIIAQLSDDDSSLTNVDPASLEAFLAEQKSITPEGSQLVVSVRADVSVPYGDIARILDIGARHGIKMVLATKAPDGLQAPHDGDPAPLPSNTNGPQQ